jgi:hypothetical protein
MATKYDEVIASGAAAEQPSNKYVSMLQEDQEFNTAVRDQSIAGAAKKNPEQHAKVVELSQQTGIPTDIVEKKQPEIEGQIRANKYTELLKDTPTLSRKYADRDFAAMAQDDVEGLTELEKSLRAPEPKEMGFWTESAGRLDKGVAVVQTSQIGISRVYEHFGVGGGISQDLLEQQNARLAELAPAMAFEGREHSWLGGVPYMIAEQLPIQAQILSTGAGGALAYATVGAAGALALGQAGPQILTPEEIITVPGAAAVMGIAGLKIHSFKGAFELEGGLAQIEYAEMRDENGVALNPDIANSAALVVGVVNGLLEYASWRLIGHTFEGLKIVTKQRIRKALLTETGRQAIMTVARRYAAVVLGEGLQEVGQEASTILGGDIAKALDQESFTDATWGDALEGLLAIPAVAGEAVGIGEATERQKEIFEQEKGAFKGGTQAGVGFAFPGTATTTVRAVAQARRAESQTQIEQGKIDKLVDVAQNSKLAQNSPETFNQLVREIEEDAGAFADIYITAEEAAGYLEAEGADVSDPDTLNPVTSAIADQLEQALSTGTDVVIQIADFMAYVPNSDNFQSLRAHVKLSQRSLTPAEAGEAQTELQTRLNKLMDAANENMEIHQQAQKIYETVEQQLIESGAVTPETAKYAAQIIPANVARTANEYNVSVEYVYQRMGLKIVGPSAAAPVAAAETLEQAPISIEEFEGTTPQVDFNAVDNYGVAWNARTVAEYIGIEADEHIYETVIDTADLAPALVEQEDAADIRVGKDDDVIDQFDLDEAEDLLEQFNEDEFHKPELDEWRDFLVTDYDEADILQLAREITARRFEFNAVAEDLGFQGEKAPPPPVVTRNPDGTYTIVDGNHRIEYWQAQGYEGIPVVLNDQRAREGAPETLFQEPVQPDLLDQPLAPEGVVETEVEARADMAALSDMLGPHLYGNMSDIAKVTVKELFQNSFDALKALIEKEGKTDSEINISVDSSLRTISVSDNGTGMTPEIIQNAFLTLAGTHKETSRPSGSFGIAKMLFLFGNENLTLVTIRDGVKTTLKTTGPNLIKSSTPGSTIPKPKMFSEPTTEASGTTVTVEIPSEYTHPNTGALTYIDAPTTMDANNVLRHSPLFEDIDVTVNDVGMEVGLRFPIEDFAPFATVKFAWGTARILISKQEKPNLTTSWRRNTHILSNGLWQFSTSMKQNMFKIDSDNIPREIYINVEPSVTPRQNNYPFDLNRQRWSSTAAEDIEQIERYLGILYFQADTAEMAQGFGGIQQVDSFGVVSEPRQLAPEVTDDIREDMLVIDEGEQIEIRDGRVFVKGKEVPEITRESMAAVSVDISKFQIEQDEVDPTQPIIHSNMVVKKEGTGFPEGTPLLDALRQLYPDRADAYLTGIGRMAIQIRDLVHEHGGGRYAGLNKLPVGTSFDHKYFGVHTVVPFRAMLLNPGVSSVDFMPGKPGEPEVQRLIANNMIMTMVHEISHFVQMNHSTDFITEMQGVISTLETFAAGEMGDLRVQFNALIRDNYDIYRYISTVIQDELVANLGVRLQDIASTEPIGGAGQLGTTAATGRDRQPRTRLDQPIEEGVGAAPDIGFDEGVLRGAESAGDLTSPAPGSIDNVGAEEAVEIDQRIKDPEILYQSFAHGGPALFDAFDIGFLGTGEGAAAFGWGLYFADLAETAEHYMRTVGGGKLTINGNDINLDDSALHNIGVLRRALGGANTRIPDDAKRVLGEGGEHLKTILFDNDMADLIMVAIEATDNAGPEAAVRWLRNKGRGLSDTLQRDFVPAENADLAEQAYADAADVLEQQEVEVSEGHLYEVEIDDDVVDDFLDYNARLSDQPIGAFFEEIISTDLSAAVRGGTVVGLRGIGDMEGLEVLGVELSDTGAELYRALADTDEQASKLLSERGIKGMKYFDASGGGRDTGDAAASRNIVVFDDSIIQILSIDGEAVSEKAQKKIRENMLDEMATSMELAQKAKDTEAEKRGSISFDPETRAATIRLMQAADLTTFLHEAGHLFLDMERRLATDPSITTPEHLKKDHAAILKFLGVDSWEAIGKDQHEKWAEAFEKYLEEGRAPSVELRAAFRRFAAWIKNAYRALGGLKSELTPEIRHVMDRMLATSEQIEAAEADLHYDPLFEDAEESGMTPEEFAAYRARTERGTNSANEKLFKKILSQLRRKTTKQWKAELANVRAEIEGDLSQEPLYRAITFMRAKNPPEGFDANKLDRKLVYAMMGFATPKQQKRDPNVVYEDTDPLSVAIAKLGGLDREAAEAEGFDPGLWTGRSAAADNMILVGKPLFRKTNGLSFSLMAESLAEKGYLSEPSTGELMDKLMADLGGDTQYSERVDFNLIFEDPNAAAEPKKRRMAPRQLRGLTAVKGGANPDTIAALFGFASGRDLVDAIVSNPTLSQAVSAAAERTMTERHGDILNDGTLEAEAQEAAHNTDRGAVILDELKALNKLSGTEAAVNQRRAARDAAERTIARKRITGLRPDLYRKAEIRAATEAEAAKIAGNVDEAQAAKQKQYLNYHLWREATKAKEKAEAIRRQLKVMQTKTYTARESNPEYTARFKMLLAAYDFNRSNRAAREQAKVQLDALKAWIEEHQDDINTDATIVESDIINRVMHYRDMTLDDLMAVRDMAVSLRHAGKRANAAEMKAYNDEMDLLAINVAEKTKGKKPLARERTPIRKAREAARSIFAAHRKTESLIREADGFQDLGPLWKRVIQPLLEAANRQIAMQEKAHDALGDIFKGHEAALRTTHDRRTFTLESGEKLRLSLGGRLVIALNWGNEGNREAMLNQAHQPMTEGDINKILATLSDTNWDTVESIWEYLDNEYWPQIAELEKRMTGVSPPRVEAIPFQLASGRIMRGGYYPIIGDPSIDWQQFDQDVTERAERLKKGGIGRAATAHGHTIARIGWGGKAVSVGIDGLFSHLDTVIHDLTHREAVRQADRVLGHKSVRDALTTALGREAVSSMRHRLAEVASGHRPPSELAITQRVFRWARLGLTYSALGFSLKTGVTQMLGLGVAISEFGPAMVLKGIMDFYSNPITNTKFIKERSVYMRDRVSTMNRDTGAILRTLRGKTTWNALKEKSFMFLLAGDLAVSRPLWWAAYTKGMDRAASTAKEDSGFQNEQDAINFADRAVSRTQQSGMLMDLSGVEDKNEFVKMWTVMYSAFSAIYNITTEQTKKVRVGKINKVQYTYALMWVIVIPALIEELTMGFDDRGDEDDENFFFNKWTRAVASYSLATMFLLRELSWTMRSGEASKLPIQRLIEAVPNLVTQLEQGELDSAAVRAVSTLVSTGAHIPGGSQATRSINYLIALDEGTEEGFNPWEFLITGPREDEE